MIKIKRQNGRRKVRWAAALAALILALQLAGCSKGTGEGAGGGKTQETSGQGSGWDSGQDGSKQPESGTGQAEGDLNGTDGADAAGTHGKSAEYDDSDLDAGWDEASSTVIDCSGSEVTIQGDNGVAENGIIRITAAGTYVLRGNFDGQLLVDAGKDDLVRLVMDGFHISNANTSPVYGKQSKKIILILAEGTDNSVTDGAEYIFGSTDEDEPDAAVFSKDDLTINGTGSLTVNGNYSNGVRSKDDLKVISGTLNITAVKDGLKGKDSVTIRDGRIQIKTGEDGIKSNNDKDPEKGYVIIEGGDIVIQAGDDAVHGETWLTVSGGTIDIQESYEGLEGLKVDITGGNIRIKSTDDGINAAGGSGGSGQDSEREKMQNNPEAYVRITGGTIVVDAMADGIDSNGNLYVEGGETYINGPVSNGDGALDYNGTAVINGGIFVAAGSSGMMQGFSEESAQNSILVFYSENQAAGSQVVLSDEDGRELLTFEPKKDFGCILLSLPGLEQGKTYQLSTAGEEQDITLDQVMTRLGEQMNGRGMGKGPGGGNGGDFGGRMPEDGRGPEGKDAAGDGQMSEGKGGMPGGGRMPRGDGKTGEEGTDMPDSARERTVSE